MPSDQSEVIANNKTPEKSEVNRLGLVLKEAPPQQRKKMNGKKGLLVVDAQGSAAAAGSSLLRCASALPGSRPGPAADISLLFHEWPSS